MEMINNYHTHTYRCGHASGQDEEYVLEAIKNGYQTLGFSDHINLQDLDKNLQYINAIKQLKEKYKDSINILIAFECELVDEYIEYYKYLKQKKLVDYLIFGNHFTVINKKVYNFVMPFDDENYLDIYYETLKKALDSKLFKYIAHIDVFLKGYQKWDDKTINLIKKIAELCENYDCYLELSGSGARSRSKVFYNNKYLPTYPFYEAFKILKDYKLKFVLGADAHQPTQLNDYATDYIKQMAEVLKLNVVDTLQEL